MGKDEILFKWKQPKQVRDFYISFSLKKGKKVLLRIPIIIFILLASFYLYLKFILPEDITKPFLRSFVILFFGIILLCGICLILLILGHLTKSYEITNKKIKKSSILGDTTIYWKKVKGYKVSTEEELPGILSLKIYSNLKPHVLFIQEGELSQDIINLFDSRVSVAEDKEKPRTKITKTELWYLFTFTLVFSICFAFLFYFKKPKISRIVFLLFTFLFGPGTIGCTFLYGKKLIKEDKLRGQALFFNFVGLVIFMLTFMLIMFYHYSQIIKEA